MPALWIMRSRFRVDLTGMEWAKALLMEDARALIERSDAKSVHILISRVELAGGWFGIGISLISVAKMSVFGWAR